MYRLRLHGLYGPRCPQSPEKPLNLTHSVTGCSWVMSFCCFRVCCTVWLSLGHVCLSFQSVLHSLVVPESCLFVVSECAAQSGCPWVMSLCCFRVCCRVWLSLSHVSLLFQSVLHSLVVLESCLFVVSECAAQLGCPWVMSFCCFSVLHSLVAPESCLFVVSESSTLVFPESCLFVVSESSTQSGCPCVMSFCCFRVLYTVWWSLSHACLLCKSPLHSLVVPESCLFVVSECAAQSWGHETTQHKSTNFSRAINSGSSTPHTSSATTWHG